jgi:tetratricopeptide (TPR) repeat protein
VTPAEALRGFLDSLGVPVARIPLDLDAQTALYRSVLAGKRVLVVLDNAGDAEQVRPLLPGTPRCLAVVTSRNRLTGLVAAEGARPLTVALLSTGEARGLLARRLGEARLAAEPEAVDEILDRCAGLPLALAIVAARASIRTDLPLAAFAAEMRAELGALDVFETGDAATDLRAVFSWSYRRLPAAAARLFRLLGLHPGPDISVAAAASLAGNPPAAVRPLLAELTRAHLLTEPASGRYSCHDLLRSYAAELAHAGEGEDDRRAAVHRVLDHYLHTALAADRRLLPQREQIAIVPPGPDVTTVDHADPERAQAWFTAERPVLLAAVDLAGSAGFDTHAWQLAWVLTTFLDRRGHWHDWARIQQAAIAAAGRLADRPGLARAHYDLGRAYARLGRYDLADAHLRQSLDLSVALGDQVNQAHTHLTLGSVAERQGRRECALAEAQQALELYRAVGHRAGLARALNAAGWAHAVLGDHRTALANCRAAVDLFPEIGDRVGEAHAWDSLGYIQHQLGDHPDAIACYRRAADLFHDLGNRLDESGTLTRLGDVHEAAGDHDAAHRVWQQAVRTLDELGHADAVRLRARLDRP